MIQWHIADIYADLEIARFLTIVSAGCGIRTYGADTESALAKQFACEAAARSARKAIEIHGCYGIMKEYPVQRLLRDALVTIPAGGTAEVGKLAMARHALNLFKQ